jgi:hypothetical protein
MSAEKPLDQENGHQLSVIFICVNGIAPAHAVS